jgi:hypothetical protein
MAGKIFISYRRGESLKGAQLLAALLAKPFGARQIFLDVRGIEGGSDWQQILEREIRASDAMVALISEGWTDAKDAQGKRRLDSPSDPVRVEIEQALKRGIPVLPVRLDGASMPNPDLLPGRMLGMMDRQAMLFRSESVRQDVEEIALRLKAVIAEMRPRGIPLGQSLWAALEYWL